ncbi:MAG: MBL fold hydrolase [Collinsella tanakaei]|nr:MAG: MBL fold hydrolase [Collinsella tanakaei]
MRKFVGMILTVLLLFGTVACNVSTVDNPPDGNKEEQTRLGGWTFRQLPSQSTDRFNNYMMSYMLIGPSGEVLVIDGGRKEDAEYLIGEIVKFGGRVDLWLLTHPHDDHIIALDRILRKNAVEIGKVAYNFPSLENIKKYASLETYESTKNFLEILDNTGIEKNIVRRGDTIKFSDLKIKILTEPDPNLTYDFVNSNSIVYRIETTQEKILILGDLSEMAGNILIKQSPDLIKDCEIVQMGHHGNGGPNEEFYKLVNPKTCFWPTPDWLWFCDNGGGEGSFAVENGGRWATLETRRWIQRLGVTENYVMKDGLFEIK